MDITRTRIVVGNLTIVLLENKYFTLASSFDVILEEWEEYVTW